MTKISSISFTGDKKIRDKRLRDVIASEEDKFYKFISRNTKFSESLINLDLRLLTNYYKSLGYYDVEINSNTAQINDKGDIDLIYSIDAGSKYTITKITTNADKIFDQQLFFLCKNLIKNTLENFIHHSRLRTCLKISMKLIDNNNLQFVEHNVEEEVDVAKAEIQIKFNIFESEKVVVERVNVVGNNVTNESVIRGELLLDEGDPFTKLRLDKSISKLKARRLFKDVSAKVTDGSEKT